MLDLNNLKMGELTHPTTRETRFTAAWTATAVTEPVEMTLPNASKKAKFQELAHAIWQWTYLDVQDAVEALDTSLKSGNMIEVEKQMLALKRLLTFPEHRSAATN